MNISKGDIKNSDEIDENLKHTFSEILYFLPDAPFIIDNYCKIMAWNSIIEKYTCNLFPHLYQNIQK